MPTWLPLANVFSVGDVLIAGGVVIAIVATPCDRHHVCAPAIRRRAAAHRDWYEWVVKSGSAHLRAIGIVAPADATTRPRATVPVHATPANTRTRKYRRDRWPPRHRTATLTRTRPAGAGPTRATVRGVDLPRRHEPGQRFIYAHKEIGHLPGAGLNIGAEALDT